MDEPETNSILRTFVEDLKRRSYSDLMQRYLGQDEALEVVGASGTRYQVEVQAFCDDPRKPNENLLVMVSIDDGSLWRSTVPKTSSFIVAPDGTFVGE